MEYIGLLSLGLLLIAGWILYRRERATAAAAARSAARREPRPPVVNIGDAAQSVDLSRLTLINQQAAERLWRLAYAAPTHDEPLDKSHAEVRVGVVARLKPEKLNPDYFPRRPTLMHQLMRAVDDPNAVADKLARMITHDPVIAADVLRMANSSLYRISPEPIESVQRAIVVCGVDNLRGILATAMVRPVFRATRNNYPRLPRLLWERTERATRIAEMYALGASPQDRFEAQLAVLLSALGPLVIYSAALDAYAKRPRLTPNPSLLVELTQTLGGEMSRRIAQEWGASARLISALQRSHDEFLSSALTLAELLGTLSVLETHTVFSNEDKLATAEAAGLDVALIESLTIPLAAA